jgi:hypothetical protein
LYWQVVVLVPRKSELNILLPHFIDKGNKAGIAQWVSRVQQQVNADPFDQKARAELLEIFKRVVSARRTAPAYSPFQPPADEDLYAIIKAMVACKELGLLNQAIGALQVQYSGDVVKLLAKFIAKVDLTHAGAG